MKSTVRGIVSLIPLLFLLATIAAAQTFTGVIRGSAQDNSGAVIAGASITIVDINTGLKRSAETNADGDFEFASLPVGVYKVEASAKSFKKAIQNNVELHINDTKVITFHLVIGSNTEQIDITADSIAVETSTGQVAGLIEGKQVRELPLNGRNFMQLTQLTPGVAQAAGFNAQDKGLNGSVNMSVSGSSANGNLWLVDGANNNDYGSNRTILVYPSIDNIEEFKILRNAYGPEFGQAAGGVVNIVTKSGTNKFHGDAYYFGRNDKLNARDWMLGQSNSPIGKLRRNDWGYTFGGPIIKDKLFFFYSQEFNHEIRGVTRSSYVPDDQERLGIFSASSVGGQPINPKTGLPITSIANMDAAGLALMQIFPRANHPNSAGQPNWVTTVSTKKTWREESGRVDYNINKKNSFSFRYSHDDWKNPAPSSLQYWCDDAFPSLEGSWSQPSESLSAKLTTTINDHTVNEFQYSFSHSAITSALGGLGDYQTLNANIRKAIPYIYGADKAAGPNGDSYPTWWWATGVFGSIVENAPWHNKQNLHNFRDGVTHDTGHHTLKAGVYFSSNLKDELNSGNWGESPSFDQNFGPLNAAGTGSYFTPGASNATGSYTGNFIADLLTTGNIFHFGETQKDILVPVRWQDFDWYLGDSWRVSRRLTFEYGFRWSFYREPFSNSDKIANFMPSLYDPAKAATNPCDGFVLTPGSTSCSDIGATASGYSSIRSFRSNSTHNIAPRLGMAFDPFGDGKWSVRGGVGQFYQRERVNALLDLSSQAPFVKVASGYRTLDSASMPYAGAYTASYNPFGGNIFGVEPNAVVPNTWQWNVTVEHELAKNTKLELAYVGSHGVHQITAYDAAMYGRLSGVSHAFIYGDHGSSSYNSLQASFSGRVGRNLTWQGVYTFSKLLSDVSGNWFGSIANGKVDLVTDVQNPKLDRGLSESNRPHIFAFNAVYNLPKLEELPKAAKFVIGDWEMASIVTAGSGNSISVFDNSNTPMRPNKVGSCSPGAGHPRNEFVNPNAFSTVGLGTDASNPTINGDASRGACQGPDYVNTDLSFYKNFTGLFKGSRLLPEGARIQFRIELFNALNHAQFQMGPNLNFNPTSTGTAGSGFGLANSTRGGREIQYALKFIF